MLHFVICIYNSSMQYFNTSLKCHATTTISPFTIKLITA